MRDRAEAILNRLGALRSEVDPAIDRLLSECPELGKSDWINRYGPASEWNAIATQYPTPILEWLIRALVTVERDLRWLGGSVAAPIWLFRNYQSRIDCDADALANWILCNRGNDYLPFGSMTSARSLEQWRVEQSRKAANKTAHVERQENYAKVKADRVRSNQDQVEQRKAASKSRKHTLDALLIQIEAMAPSECLSFIVRNPSVPLEVFPEAVIGSLLQAVASIDDKKRAELLKRIDRRTDCRWKVLRMRLRQFPLGQTRIKDDPDC